MFGKSVLPVGDLEEDMKFKIGSQWKTRGGWRAVVVAYQDCKKYPYLVWHDNVDNTRGQYNLCYDDDTYDLIEPWKEPVVHEVEVKAVMYSDLDVHVMNVDHTPCDDLSHKEIARIKIKFEEGEGLDANTNQDYIQST